MRIVCFDTNVLVWGLKESGKPEYADMEYRAKAFLEYIREEKFTVIVPTVVVAEFLSPIPEEMHYKFMNYFSKSFAIVPFDYAAARQYSIIWNKKWTLNSKKTQEAMTELNYNKAKLKIDYMIVATAIARKADCIYTHNRKDLEYFASEYIRVSEMPGYQEDLKLF